MVGLYFPAWLTSQGLADSALSVVEAAAGLTVIFVAPWVGARSDARQRRVPTLVVTTLVAVSATASLATGPHWLTLAGLGVALVAFNTGSVVYDALLPHVSTPEERGTVSGLGVGVGYLGSFIGLGIGMVGLEVLNLGYSGTFQLIAAGFLLFALPSFFLIPENPTPSPRLPALGEVATRIVAAWRTAASIPGMVRFLCGRFLYTDAINTLIGGFLAIYAIEELGLSPAETRDLLAVAIAAAIPGSLASGWAVRAFGATRVLRATMVAWLVALAAGISAGADGEEWLAWLVAGLGGAALGSTWTADRVVMVELSPPRLLGEMYGLYATVGRFATIVGPLVWALIVDGLGLARPWALAALAVFVAAALAVLAGLPAEPASATPRGFGRRGRS